MDRCDLDDPAARALLDYRESLKRKQQAVTPRGAIGPGNALNRSETAPI